VQPTFFLRHSSHARDTFDLFLGAVSIPLGESCDDVMSFIDDGTVRGEMGPCCRGSFMDEP